MKSGQPAKQLIYASSLKLLAWTKQCLKQGQTKSVIYITVGRQLINSGIIFWREIKLLRCLMTLCKRLLLCAGILIISILLGLQLIFAQQSLINAPYSLTPSERTQARAIFKRVKSSHQAIELLTLNNNDLNACLNYLSNRYILSGIYVIINQQRLGFTVSLVLPENPLWRYMNVKFQLQPPYDISNISELQIGDVFIADQITQFFINQLTHYRPFIHYYTLIKRHILAIKVENEKLVVSYIPHPLPPLTAERKAIEFYMQKIAQLVRLYDPQQPLSLSALFNPLFKIAYQRSTLDTAIKENKVLIMAVNEYVNRKEIQRYMPFQIAEGEKQAYRPVILYGRSDLPKHFTTSAVLAMTSSSFFATAMGVEKELRDRDAKHGSGFSFVDLASDRAGIKFSQTAIASSDSARQLQLKMVNTHDDAAFVPKLDDFPENMSHKTFLRRFGSVYSAEYETVVAEIDQRIAALPIYQSY